MMPTAAARRWGETLAQWAIPPEILAQAPASPWGFPPHLFAADAEAAHADSPSHRRALAALGEAGTVLDVGCGGGRSSLPLAPAASSVTGVDEDEALLASFAAAFEGAGVAHHEVRGRWPDVAATVAVADVVVCHHVVYNVADIGPFVDALTDHAGREVVVELTARHPMAAFDPLWRHFWGIERPGEPTAELFLEIVGGRGAEPHVERAARPPRRATRRDPGYVEFVRRRLCLGPERDAEIAEQLAALDDGFLEDAVTVAWPGTA